MYPYCKTPLGETGCLGNPYFFALAASASSFLIHSHVTYGMPCHARGHLHSLTCDLRDAMPRQRSLTLIPKEAEDFPRGEKHFKHVPPPTYLILFITKRFI